MTTPTLPELNTNELDIMKILWKRGRLSARELHDVVAATRSWSYSTTRTVLERMCKKGLAHKQAFHGINVYAAGINKPRGLAGLVRAFASQVLEMDLAPVVSLFAQGEALTSDELEELTQILAAAEGGPS